MTYDGYIEKDDPSGGDPIILAEVGNYTSNVGPMWALALHEAAQVDSPLWRVQGPCSEVAPILRSAAEWMRSNPTQMQPLNPKNGWGNYAGALQYLEHAAGMCELYADMPSARVRWSA